MRVASSLPPSVLPPGGSDDARLKKTAQQLEGLFVQQLYKAMRETVPQNEGAVDGGDAEDMFTGLMDQHIATETPTQWAHGLAAAAYRQLRGALPAGGEDGARGAPSTTPLPPDVSSSLLPARPL